MAAASGFAVCRRYASNSSRPGWRPGSCWSKHNRRRGRKCRESGLRRLLDSDGRHLPRRGRCRWKHHGGWNGEGDVVAVGGGVLLGDNASVPGDVVTVGGHLSRHPNAVVRGDVNEKSGALLFLGVVPRSADSVDPDHRADCLAGQPKPEAAAGACRKPALIRSCASAGVADIMKPPAGT